MPALVEVQCPNCRTVLKLNSRKPLGRTVPCPKCEETFVARERKRPAAQPARKPAADSARKPARKRPAHQPVQEAAVIDDDEEFDDVALTEDYGYEDYGYDDAPPTRRKSRRKKSKSSRAWVKWVLIGSGGALGLAIIGIGIWLIVGMFSKKLDLAYLPPDADRISVVRAAEMWKSELVQEMLTGTAKEDVRRMKEDFGIEPAEIISVTEGSQGNDRVKVVRTSIDMDAEKILKQAGNYEKSEYDGHTLYRIGNNALYFPDKRTAVSGPEASVKAAIDRGPKYESRDDLKFVDAGYQIVTVHVNTSEERERQRNISGSINGLRFARTIANAEGKSFTSSIKTKKQHRFASVEDAKEYEQDVRKRREKVEEELKDLDSDSLRRNMTEEQKRKAKEQAREWASSYSYDFSRSGDVINETMSITPTKTMRERGRLFFLGVRTGTQIHSLAKSPHQLFGFSSISSRRPSSFRRNTRVAVYEVTLGSFRGAGDREAAVRDALKNVSGLNTVRMRITGNTVRLYSQRGKFPSTLTIRGRLRAAGFRNASVRTTGTE
ncbi:MAG: MJ0042-type zinc finger domain-containing protein [Planctomycetaceae bacterium]